jgi:uncharacterized lipoprotein YddW (UPF0748 family)
MRNILSMVWLLSLACFAYTSSNQLTFRGIWVPSNDFETKIAADTLLQKLEQANINAIFPVVMMHGKAYYKTSHYRYTVAATDKFDPLAYIIKAAHKKNISVHPWFCVYYEGAVDTIIPKNPDWLTPGYGGESTGTQYFLDPTLPEVKSYLKSVMLDVLKYDIDGFHLDYIRYCGNLFGYGDKSRALFNQHYGFDPLTLVTTPDIYDAERFNQYPIYCLEDFAYNLSHVWIPNRIEPYLTFAGIRPKFIQAERLTELPIPSAVIITGLYPIDSKTITNVSAYLTRGGNLVYMETGNPGFVDDTTGELKRAWENKIVKQSEKITIESFEQGADRGPEIYAKLVELAQRNGRKFDQSKLAKMKQQWDVWRANQIQDLVFQLHQEIKKQNKKIVISAAVGDLENDKIVVLRDTGGWLKSGLVDALCPMDYTESVQELETIIAKSKHDAGIKWQQIYPGLSLYTRGAKGATSRDPKGVAEQIQAVKSSGYTGIMLFCSNQLNDLLVQTLHDNLK